jgi:hypothetical protein
MPETAVANKTAIAARRSLGIIGYILSGVTAVVIGIGVLVVQAQLTGDHISEDSRPNVSNSLPTVRR